MIIVTYINQIDCERIDQLLKIKDDLNYYVLNNIINFVFFFYLIKTFCITFMVRLYYVYHLSIFGIFFLQE